MNQPNDHCWSKTEFVRQWNGEKEGKQAEAKRHNNAENPTNKRTKDSIAQGDNKKQWQVI